MNKFGIIIGNSNPNIPIVKLYNDSDIENNEIIT